MNRPNSVKPDNFFLLLFNALRQRRIPLALRIASHSLLLVVMWVVMVSDLTFGTLFLGIVFGILVPIFTAPWWPERPPVRFVPVLGYLGIVLWDIVVANFHVAAII